MLYSQNNFVSKRFGERASSEKDLHAAEENISDGYFQVTLKINITYGAYNYNVTSPI